MDSIALHYIYIFKEILQCTVGLDEEVMTNSHQIEDLKYDFS